MRRSDRELNAQLAQSQRIGRRAKASSENPGTYAYLLEGDGEAAFAARVIEKIRKSDGATVRRIAFDTQALEIVFRVDAFRNRYYIDDGETGSCMRSLNGRHPTMCVAANARTSESRRQLEPPGRGRQNERVSKVRFGACENRYVHVLGSPGAADGEISGGGAD